MKKSPFAPVNLPDMPEIDGVRLAACEAGIRYQGRKDLLLALFPPQTAVAGVFTQSKTASAPVDWCRLNLAQGCGRALVVNSGNANAFTGVRGRDAVELTAVATAAAVGCDKSCVFLASTGVIGEPLDAAAFTDRLSELAEAASAKGWHDAAAAIMTTDTFAKMATRTARIDGIEVTLNGMAKGSGMIAPDMATMLAFVFTDAPIAAPLLQQLLQDGAEKSFNAVTIDSDTSTSDTLLAFATQQAGKRGVEPVTELNDPRLTEFHEALDDLLRDLAIQVAKDGEGLTKFVTITVTGGEDDKAARTIARSIANSPLVKTAIAGEDPNWGRVVMAVGKAGEAADRDKLSIRFGDILVAEHGEVAPGYREELGADYMKNPELVIAVDVGIGGGSATVWTCDLTHGYISINADYRS